MGSECSTNGGEKECYSRISKLSFGTQRLIIVVTRTCHYPLSWVRSIQSIPSYSLSFRLVSILSSHLRLGLPGLLSHQIPISTTFSSMHATFPAHLILLYPIGLLDQDLPVPSNLHSHKILDVAISLSTVVSQYAGQTSYVPCTNSHVRFA
jgi:hypothetical protein